MASVTRHWWAKVFWAIWPAWVWFAVMATGNHFWLDCLAGMVLAIIAMTVVYRGRAIARHVFGTRTETA